MPRAGLTSGTLAQARREVTSVRDLSVSDVLKLVRRWWWVFILCPLLAGGAAYAVSNRMTRIYEGSATIFVDQGQAPGTDSFNAIQASQQLVGTYSQLATTRPVLDATIKQLNLPTTPEALIKQVSVAPVGTTQLLKISVDDQSPELAAKIANTLAQVFIDQTTQAQQAAAGSSRDQIKQSINAVQSRIDSNNAKIAQLQRGPNASSPSIQNQISQLQAQVSQDNANLASLLEAQQQMDLAAAQGSAQIRIAELAVPPTTFVKPRIVLNTGLAAVLGILVAAGLVLVAGYVDDTVKSTDEMQRQTGKAALGAIPALRSPNGVEAVAHPNSAATEAYRTMRTNFQFASAGQQIRSMVVTSFRPGDGKTTTIVNLAAVLAQGGQRVILIDADLRKPQIHKHFNDLTTRTGLTNLVLSSADVHLQSLLRQTDVPGLRVLPSGPLPPNPPDVLNSPRMRQIVEQLEAEADIVLFDAPPMAVSDALILGGLVDRTLLVALQGRTRSSELVRATRELERIGTPLAGIVLNRVKLERSSHYYAYYRAYYGSEEKAATSRKVAADRPSGSGARVGANAPSQTPTAAAMRSTAPGQTSETRGVRLRTRPVSRVMSSPAAEARGARLSTNLPPTSSTPTPTPTPTSTSTSTAPAKSDWLAGLLLWCTKRSRRLGWLILPNSSGSGRRKG